MKKGKIVLIALSLLLLIETVIAVETTYGETYKRECDGGSCVKTLYGGSVFYKLGNSSWVVTEDAITAAYVDGILNVSFPDIGQNIVFGTYITVSGTEYGVSDYVKLVNGSEAKFVAEKKGGYWHWYANITGLGSVKDNVEKVSFKEISNKTNPAVQGYVRQYGNIYVDFSDLNRSGFVVSNLQNEISVWNVTGKENLLLDPEIILVGNSTGINVTCGNKNSAGEVNPYTKINMNDTFNPVGLARISADQPTAVLMQAVAVAPNCNADPASPYGYGVGLFNFSTNLSAEDIAEFNLTVFTSGSAGSQSILLRNQTSGGWYQAKTHSDTNGVPIAYSFNFSGAAARDFFSGESGASAFVYSINNSNTLSAANIYLTLQRLTVLYSVSVTPNATEVQARASIEHGINSSLDSRLILTGQQVYGRNLSNSQILGRFDKVAISGSKRWAFNYINTSESHVRMFNLTPSFYVLEMANMTTDNIINDVSNLINATK